MCLPSGFCIIGFIFSFQRWRINKIDVKTSFLQTGNAQQNVYVIPPIESDDRNKCLWLFLTASYGLVNVNAEWLAISDQVICDIGLVATTILPQIFYLKNHNQSITVVLAKFAEDFFLCDKNETIVNVISAISNRFTLGKIVYGPGLIRYFGLNITQYDD